MAGARKIIGSDSPLPYLNEIPMTAAISRFLREIKVIDLVGNKDTPAIQKAIDPAPPLQEAKLTSQSCPRLMKTPGKNTKNW